VTDITGSGIFVLLPELPLCDEQRRQKNSSIAMASFDELAEMKTAVSKQQLHFKQRQKMINLPLIPDTRVDLGD
jgi:hypothetical protein